MKGKLTDRVAVITGGSQGLGFAIAKSFVEEGANVCICARDKHNVQEAATALFANKQHPHQQVLSAIIDVSQPNDIEVLKKQVFDAFDQVHILVNNAGIYGPMGPIETVDWEAWKHTVDINLYGPLLFCRAFLPHFRQKGYGKIIQIAGGGATNPMPRFEAYAASKSAVVRSMESIAQDCLLDHIDINSVSPGLLDTRFLDELLAAGPEVVGKEVYQRMLKAKKENATVSLQMGADLCVFLASAASDGITGRLISAVWDKYMDWPKHISEIQQSDVYTLRRITGRERGIAWGDK